jgi:hypothetical protein
MILAGANLGGDPERLGFYDRQLQFVIEPEAFHDFTGTSSTGGLEGHLEVIEPAAASWRYRLYAALASFGFDRRCRVYATINITMTCDMRIGFV